MATLGRSVGLTPANRLRIWGMAGLGLVVIALIGLLTLPLHYLGGVSFTVVLVVLTIAAALAFVGIVLVIYSARQGRVYEQDIQHMLAGKCWAHWHIGADEAHHAAAAERAESDTQAWHLIAGGFGIGAVVAVIVALAGVDALGGLVAGGVFGLAGVISGSATYLSGRVRYRPAIGQSGDIYISAVGVYQGGHYLPFKGFNLHPISARLRSTSPEVLEITTASQGRYGTTTATVPIPVPSGREAEAAAIIDRLRQTYGWTY